MAMTMWFGMIMVRLFATLPRGLEIKLPASVINSYNRVGIASENRACLDGGSNIGGNDAHEGNNNDATKNSELRERVSIPWS
jgi:hypothetical protein